MASLLYIEKKSFEDLFGMSSGYVLDFTDRTFSEFFRSIAKVNIDDIKYSVNGTSKAKRLRTFCEIDSDAIVGKILAEMLKIWEHNSTEDFQKNKNYLLCKKAIEKLFGKSSDTFNTEIQFLEKDFSQISLKKLPLDSSLISVLEVRIKEIEKCSKSCLWLSAVIMAGSVAEGLLLGIALTKPQKFNESKISPKDKNGKVHQFQHWTLKDFIDVAYDIQLIKDDIKKFSHALKDFRNYIHPYQQMISGFTFDEHTTKICIQVLHAIVADLSNQR
jgi:hypothetical protein